MEGPLPPTAGYTMKITHLLLVIFTLGFLPLSLTAQRSTSQSDRLPGRIIGEVMDARTGGGVQGVVVRLLPPVDRQAVTNTSGHFAFHDVPAGVQEIEVSHIAYATASELVNVPEGSTVQLWIEVEPDAIDVGSIDVRVAILNPRLEDEGFYDRNRMGFGHFFDEIDLRGRTLSSALREGGVSLAGGASVFASYPYFRRSGRTCAPVLWLDRRMIRLRGFEMEALVEPRSIAAMEIYRPGNTPGEFMYTSPDCGAIVFWTQAHTW